MPNACIAEIRRVNNRNCDQHTFSSNRIKISIDPDEPLATIPCRLVTEKIEGLMATGVQGREKLGKAAVVAAKQKSGLPDTTAPVRLEYPEKQTEWQTLKPTPVSFVAFEKNGLPSKLKTIKPNTLMLADNLGALHTLIQDGVKPTLIYLDPPYGTGLNFQSRELRHAYSDADINGPATFTEFMRRRFILMREILADDGSIYVHIGHQMLFHMKMCLDEVFGANNFRNLITRRKCSSKNFTRNQYPNLHDYLLFYSKTSNYKWNQPSTAPDPEWISREYPKVDSKGQYKLVPIHAPGTRFGNTGKPWRGLNPPPGKHWQYMPSRLDELDAAGEIHWSKTGNPRRKVYLQADKGIPLTDYWERYRDAHHQSIAITGYPTEKNIDMMRMIVQSATAPGDLVLDPFCGSGTTLQAAQETGRKWLGIDQSFVAAETTVRRLRHGSKPMGDYVAKAKPREKHRDLFEGLPKVSQEAASQFYFAADGELLADYKQELVRIAKI
jgi:adenine-specific DNA-methyltransferase